MQNAPFTDVTLLVVDDDPAMAVMAQMALAPHGYRVRTAASGKEALDAVAQTPPDIVVLDVVMPGMGGFEVCRRLTATPPAERLPVIIVTSLDDSASIEMAYEAGASAFVTKPINWPILRHQLQYVLRASRDRARLAESEERYALAAAGSNDGLWDWRVVDQRLYLSPRWLEQLRLRNHDIGGDIEGWFRRIHPDDELQFRSALNTHLAGGSSNFEVEYRLRGNDDQYRWMLCRGLAIRDGNGDVVRMAGSQTDITARKETEERLVHDALHDPLTGLANRKLLLERINHAMQLAERHQEYRFAVAVMDLDRFKNINDSLGHLAGDGLLQHLAKRVVRRMRATDTLARIGGDEFAILFDDTGGMDELEHLTQRVLRDVSRPVTLLDHEVVTTASLGIAVSTPAYARAEDMVRDADIAMYRAKALGKNRFHVFDSTMHTQVSEMLQMENELRIAVRDRQLRIHYQPIRHLASGRVVGCEALVRWQHPRLGLLAPASFLAVAEETGLMVAIDQWALRTATRQLASWHAQLPQAHDTYVAVNLSSAEFAHPDLLAHVSGALADAGLDPDNLRLEVTETVLIENMKHSRQVLEALRAQGVSTAIDDFGTGYSSFSYLDRLAFDALKIDRAFIDRIDRNTKRREIVRAIIAMAEKLGLDVVAEGGENSDEIHCLREIGCEFNQGFHFSQALPPEELVTLLEKNGKPQLTVLDGERVS